MPEPDEPTLNRRIARVLLLLLLLAAAPLPACAFPGPPLTPQDRFCAVARAGAYTVYVRGYVRHGGGAILTLAIADAAGQPPDVTVTLAGEPPIAAQPAPAPSGDAAALAWYTLTLAPAAVAAPLRLHVAGDAGAGDATVRLLHPACDHTAPPVSLPDQAPAAPVHPAQRYQAHIVQPDDLNPAWSPADASVLQQAGLPVPATATALVNVFAAAPAAADISRDTVQHTGADTETPVADDAYAAGWTPLLRADFDAGWPWAGRQQACRLLRMANTPGLGWGEDRTHTFGGSPGGAAPIMASGSVTSTARERVVQLACVFADLAQAHNLMAQFALWRDPADAGGSLFVGASYDGRNFIGRRWQAADAGQGAEGGPGWTEQRIFFPFTGAQTTAGAGRLLGMSGLELGDQPAAGRSQRRVGPIRCGRRLLAAGHGSGAAPSLRRPGALFPGVGNNPPAVERKHGSRSARGCHLANRGCASGARSICAQPHRGAHRGAGAAVRVIDAPLADAGAGCQQAHGDAAAARADGGWTARRAR